MGSPLCEQVERWSVREAACVIHSWLQRRSVLTVGGSALLVDVVTDGFVLHCCGPKAAPFALVASYQWEDFVDLITIRRVDQITTARVPAPRHGRIDLFAPTVVVWTYEGPPQCALRALFVWLTPGTPTLPPARTPRRPLCRFP